MKTTEIIIPEEIAKNMAKLNYYDEKQFIQDAKTYIKAIKERRMLCIIKSISASGMSRILKFNSCEVGKNGANYRQYSCLFIALGFSEVKNKDAFRVHGCGMDMVFDTNYRIIHMLKRIGLIDDQECRELAQLTPVIL